jgi:hypothetical protein
MVSERQHLAGAGQDPDLHQFGLGFAELPALGDRLGLHACQCRFWTVDSHAQKTRPDRPSPRLSCLFGR